MGGSKKKSPAQQEKSQKDEKKAGKKGKKEESGSAKAEITVILTDEQASKVLKSSKVVTVQELARRTGVKISAANVYLKKLLESGAVKKIGGHSGHHIYQPISS